MNNQTLKHPNTQAIKQSNTKKDQFVIAYITDLEQNETVVSHASFFARRLGKGLILLHVSDPRYTKVTPDEAERKLNGLCETQASKQQGNQTVTYAALSGETKQVLTSLPTLMNAVLVVAQVSAKAGLRSPQNRRNVIRDFAECRAAFLTVQTGLSLCRDAERYHDVAMVVDFKKESKDKFIWSSYFPRFLGSRMHVLYLDYKDQFLHSKWYANMQQLHKLYTGLEISFQPHIINSNSTFPDTEALSFANEQGYNLLICVTTKERDTLEFFIGTQELRTITNRYNIPILFLNPREDLYVLCD